MAILPAQESKFLRNLVAGVPVIPVLTVDDAQCAVPLARALVAGGLPVLEVTLRTDAALDVISQMSTVTGAVVGAGTVLTEGDVRAAKSAGARFAVSPGSTPALLDACKAGGLPLLPGAATASEVMLLLECGYDFVKFFPAEASGGVSLLKAISAPLPQISFCPTGGVNTKNAPAYLSLPNVLCVGGSWVVRSDLIVAKDWPAITALAKSAVKELT